MYTNLGQDKMSVFRTLGGQNLLFDGISGPLEGSFRDFMAFCRAPMGLSCPGHGGSISCSHINCLATPWPDLVRPNVRELPLNVEGLSVCKTFAPLRGASGRSLQTI